jgi:AmmeMemoRadiSam system protein B/AmmeMemoRadiSam system protein A
VNRPIALVLPHAGYVFCSRIMADGYNAARGHHYDVVVLLGTNHTTAGYRRAGIFPGRGFRTPLGVAEIDGTLVERLLAECGGDCALDAAVHAREHSVEVQVPFVQRVFPGVKILPVVVGEPEIGLCRRFGRSLARALKGRQALIVASSDLSHYPQAKDAEGVDRATLEAIASLDPSGFQKAASSALRRGNTGLVTAACGEAPILAAMVAAKELGATRGTIISYTHSGLSIYGDTSRVVGYGAVAFTADGRSPDESGTGAEGKASGTAESYGVAQRKKMLSLARKSIDSALAGRGVPQDQCEPDLMQPRGVFVTLKKGGELRGCIGRIIPLSTAMARAAAFEDPRFPPLKRDELSAVSIEISVLTPLKRVAGGGDIIVGRDGVLLQKDGNSAVYLPQVATEQGWSRKQMLDHLCLKGGMRPGCWKDAQLSVFQAEAFHEDDRPSK